MARAHFAGTVIAESDDTVVVDGNHYFPSNSLHREHVQDNDLTTVCSWKGIASYYDVVVGDQRADAAAWYYLDAKPDADHIRDHVAFGGPVEVEA